MRRRSKDFIEISDHTSLDMLIKTLCAIRDNLDEHAQPELKLRGDDVFGRRMSISYFREISQEEADLEARYDSAQRLADAAEMDRLQRALNEISSVSNRLRNAA